MHKIYIKSDFISLLIYVFFFFYKTNIEFVLYIVQIEFNTLKQIKACTDGSCLGNTFSYIKVKKLHFVTCTRH